MYNITLWVKEKRDKARLGPLWDHQATVPLGHHKKVL